MHFLIYLRFAIVASVSCVTGYKLVDSMLQGSSENLRDSRFFVFIPDYRGLRFENTDCIADTGQGRRGNCYTRRECRTFGGRAAGPCASNHGVCCIVEKTCGGRTEAKQSYFLNPGYPLTHTGSKLCSIRIKKFNPKTCQLRLDFENSVSLVGPGAQGECLIDKFEVENGGTEVPQLCGELTDQHVYVDYLEEDISIDITMKIGPGRDPRQWVVRITQIACDSEVRGFICLAMSGCLQYFTALSGTVMSFNYAARATEEINEPTGLRGTREIQSLNYGVCIKAAPEYCRIRWQKSENNSFLVSGDAGSLQGPTYVPPALSGEVCTEDYVVIPGGLRSGSEESQDRYCGTNFIRTISETKPFMMYVVTNNMEFDPENRGFELRYDQIQCGQDLTVT